jgi:effector-binding domain-containing protein
MEIKDVEEQNTLMVRLTTSVKELPAVMGEIYQEIASYMGQGGIEFAGPPYAMYYNMDMDALDVEIGFPIGADDKGKDRVKQGRIPGGQIVTATHFGPYGKLEETYTKLMEFVKEKKLSVHEWMYEYYLNSPMEVKPEELQTQICFVLK